MSAEVHFTVEVEGCPTVCTHCWAQGGAYRTMPIEDVRFVLEQARRYCAEKDLSLSAFPMHEVAAHPQAVEIFHLFHQSGVLFEPLSTTGVPLAIRSDWEEILDTLLQIGTTTVWLALHGVDEVHDRAVHRVGAYQETMLAAQRIKAKGLRIGYNIFLTKENLAQFDRMIEGTRIVGADELSIEIANYNPTTRGRRYEPSRPELNELLPLAKKISQLSNFWKAKWADLDQYTEAAHLKNALENSGNSFDYTNGSRLQLVCRNNLDVHLGVARLYGERLGNLREDGAEQVLGKGVAHGMLSSEAVFYSPDRFPPVETFPSVAELARKFGDAQGQKVYLRSESMRYRWLDLHFDLLGGNNQRHSE